MCPKIPRLKLMKNKFSSIKMIISNELSYFSLGMIEPFRVLQNSDFRLLTCASGTFTMFAKFFKRLMQVIFN